MDDLDRQLVAALIRNPRADLREIAAETTMVPTSAQNRLRSLEEAGVVSGFTARIDYDRLGYQTVVVRIATDVETVDAVTARLRERPAFVTVYEVSGEYNVVAVGKFNDEATLNACVRDIVCDVDVRAVTVETARVVGEGGSPMVGGA